MASILSFFKNNWKISLVVVVILVFLFQCHRIETLKTEKEMVEAQKKREVQNLKAINDSVRKSIDLSGDDLFLKKSFQAHRDSLKKWDSLLSDKIDEIKGDVSQATEVEYIVKHDTVRVNTGSTDLGGGRFRLDWSHDTSFGENNRRYLSGETLIEMGDSCEPEPLYTNINDDIMEMDLFTGIRETDGGGREIFVKSDHPGFQVNELHGAELGEITPQRKRDPSDWVVVGPQAGITYTSDSKFAPYIGIGVTLNGNKAYRKVKRTIER